MSDRPQTRECSIDQLQPELLKLAKQYISNTDRILICFETKREWSSGFLGFGIKCRLFAAICTQRRVIRVMHNYRDDDYVDEASTMELVDIESIQESQHEYSRGVQLSGRGGAQLGLYFDSGEASSKFANILRVATEQAKTRASNSPSATPSSVDERIRFLKKLRQDGTLTEAQFQQKLQEIINQL